MQRRNTKSEYELLSDAVAELARSRVFPLVFGGLASRDGVHISALHGHRTPYLAGLHVRLHRGLGGRSMGELRPRLASDYRASRAITHDYDRQVLGEHVRTLLAVPIVVDAQVRGVIYGAHRTDCSVGSVSIDPAVEVARRLQRALADRDRVELLRVEQRVAAVAPSAGALAGEQLERLRASFAELRAITATVDDPVVAERLRALEQELAAIGAPAPTDEPAPHLSPRELDVLGYAALGLRNAEIGGELGLTESTVKSYMGAAMQKLGQSSRHAAVAEARRQGLLP